MLMVVSVLCYMTWTYQILNSSVTKHFCVIPLQQLAKNGRFHHPSLRSIPRPYFLGPSWKSGMFSVIRARWNTVIQSLVTSICQWSWTMNIHEPWIRHLLTVCPCNVSRNDHKSNDGWQYPNHLVFGLCPLGICHWIIQQPRFNTNPILPSWSRLLVLKLTLY